MEDKTDMDTPYQKLKRLSDDQLIERYNQDCAHFSVYGATFILDELARRRSDKQNETVVALTKRVYVLSIWMAVMATISAISVIVQLLGIV
ncbi:hypothetical protein [Brucella pituitosa]|uniref:hypothetical protein n=1 Tax=Brucella pituitosa TaxID=571256 RepID=UPI003F4ADE77